MRTQSLNYILSKTVHHKREMKLFFSLETGQNMSGLVHRYASYTILHILYVYVMYTEKGGSLWKLNFYTTFGSNNIIQYNIFYPSMFPYTGTCIVNA